MIGIINYGMGNLASVRNALEKLGIACRICESPEAAEPCDRLILPGVGAFGHAMQNLQAAGWFSFLQRACLRERRPFLGICLGMQLLFEYSLENGRHTGLGFIKGGVEPFAATGMNLRIPHMGWNAVEVLPKSRLLPTSFLENLAEPPTVYFVHSFYCQPKEISVVSGVCDYGIRFAAMLECGNLMACQFHPEKSQKIGFEILRNFSSIGFVA